MLLGVFVGVIDWVFRSGKWYKLLKLGKNGPNNAMKRASSEQLAPISEQQKSV